MNTKYIKTFVFMTIALFQLRQIHYMIIKGEFKKTRINMKYQFVVIRKRIISNSNGYFKSKLFSRRRNTYKLFLFTDLMKWSWNKQHLSIYKDLKGALLLMDLLLMVVEDDVVFPSFVDDCFSLLRCSFLLFVPLLL